MSRAPSLKFRNFTLRATEFCYRIPNISNLFPLYLYRRPTTSCHCYNDVFICAGHSYFLSILHTTVYFENFTDFAFLHLLFLYYISLILSINSFCASDSPPLFTATRADQVSLERLLSTQNSQDSSLTFS